MSGRLGKLVTTYFPISFMHSISSLSLGTNSYFSFLSHLCVFLDLSTMVESEEEDGEDDSDAYLLCAVG